MNIMIVGVGGQGTLLTSRIIGKTAISAGYDVKISEVHGMAQRGGSVVTYVRFGEKVSVPTVEEGSVDLLLAFEKMEALRYAHYLKKDGVLVVNNREIPPVTVLIGAAEYPDGILEKLQADHTVYTINGEEIALGLGNAKVLNSVVLGLSARFMPFSKEAWLKELENTVPSKTITLNTQAFLLGHGNS